MIQRVHIQGFQSLADVDLELGGFTVIQGKSNSGKSAFIRALRAVVTNAGNLRGTGGSFIHHGSKACVVTVERETGKLVWRKTQTTTKYDVNGREFTTGQDVPDEVAAFLKLGDIPLDKDTKVNVNIQGGGRDTGQFEPPFLVVDKPGSYRAKVMALLTSANVLYAAQAVAKKKARSDGGTLKTMREVHEGETARLVDLEAQHAPLVAASERAQQLRDQYVSAVAERDRLTALQVELARVDAELAEVEAQIGPDVDFTSRLANLDQALSQAASYEAWRRAVAAVDEELAQLDTQDSKPLPDTVPALLATIDQQVTAAGSYRAWVDTIAALDAQLLDVDRQLTDNAAERDAAIHALHEVVADIDYCPTCDQKLEVQVMTA